MKKGELCQAQSARGRAALAGRFFLGTRHFLLLLYASAETVTGAKVVLGIYHYHHRSLKLLRSLNLFWAQLALEKRLQ
jgi:hypothetical protein